MGETQSTSLSFIQGRGEKFCRGCNRRGLFSALDLGELPIANELLLTQEGYIVGKDSPLFKSGWLPSDSLSTGLEWVLNS